MKNGIARDLAVKLRVGRDAIKVSYRGGDRGDGVGAGDGNRVEVNFSIDRRTLNVLFMKQYLIYGAYILSCPQYGKLFAAGR